LEPKDEFVKQTNVKQWMDKNNIKNLEFVKQTNVKQWMDKNNIKNLDELYKKTEDWKWFWEEISEEISKEMIEFYSPYKKLIEWDAPWVNWFVGAKYNIVHDALDKHVKTWRKNKVAFIFEGEPGDVRKFTYNDVYIEVNKLANSLRKLGIKKGDRVGIYMPMLPELPIAMLACAKIGAIHSVVFSGFSSLAFRDRINDCEAKVVITCDGFWRRGRKVYLKEQADVALEDAPSVKHVIVYKRTGDGVPWTAGRDVWWHDLVFNAPKHCKTEELDANDPLFFLYTSLIHFWDYR